MPGPDSMGRSVACRALFLTALAPLIWSTGGIGVRVLDQSPATILFWRSLFASAALSAWCLLRYRGDFLRVVAGNLRRGWPVALCISLSFIFYVFSVSNTSVASSLLIQGTAPVFIVLLGWFFLRESPPPITFVSLFAVLGGIGIIMGGSISAGGLSGKVFGLLKALSFAAGAVAIRGLRNVTHLPAAAAASILTVVFSAAMGPEFLITRDETAILASLGIIQTGLGFILFVTWSGYLTPSQTGLLVILEACAGPIWPWIFLNERPTSFTFLGGSIIIAALVFHSVCLGRSTGPRRNRHPTMT